MLMHFTSIQDVEALFDLDPEKMHVYTSFYIAQARKLIEHIETAKSEHDNFQTLLVPFDRARALVQVLSARLRVLHMVSSQLQVREHITQELNFVENFADRYITYNKVLYKRIKAYAKVYTDTEQLTQAQQKFLYDTLETFKRNGLELSQGQQEHLKNLYVHLAQYTELFETNILYDRHKSYVKGYDLKGVRAQYLKYVRRTTQGRYILYADTHILETSDFERTRKKFWRMAVTIAYPENEECLKKIIAIRDAIAQVLGFTSYAHFDIANQMAGTPDRVEQFLATVIQHVQHKARQEKAEFQQYKPDTVMLAKSNKIEPWDLLYIKNYYKTQVLSLDEAALSEYFPFDHVFTTMLAFYQEFFGVVFKPVTGKFWHAQVYSLIVYAQDICIGFVLLDIYARPGKYLFTLEQPICAGVKTAEQRYPGVSVIIASFEPAVADRPSLLRRTEVTSLFHEFGHALHTLLGAQPLALQSGTHVTRDFAELPSQVLQQWVTDPLLLKKISRHYKTGKQLPESILQKLAHIENFYSADDILEQCYLALFSLYCFKEGPVKDIFALHEKLLSTVRVTVEFSPEDHSYASFDHLITYGAKYYSYIWARVYALDVFYVMQERIHAGTTLGAVGKQYVDALISRGGSSDPWVLLQDFLGRAPTIEPFLQHFLY